MKDMKRAAIATLLFVGVFALCIWTGRSSATILPSRSQLLEEMNQAQRSQEIIASLRREVAGETLRRIEQDPMHRYGGQTPVGKNH
jgi:ABC-type nitrate/sulfonate/bicarbonate transport system permease component